MSLHLITLGLSVPSSINNRKPINHFAVSCNTKFSMFNGWGSKCAAAANKKDHLRNTRLLSLQLDCRRQALKHVVTNCYKLSGEEDKGSKEDDLRTKVAEVYWVLKSELLNDPDLGWTDDSRQWVNQVLDYNVLPGEIGRERYVIDSYKLLKDEGEELSEDEVFDASVLTWCIKWLEAAGLIHDDYSDNSYTRYDKPCWFRLPKVGSIALNDAILLMAHVPRILRNHFSDKPYYVDLLHLFNESVFEATSGQMLDLTTPEGGERDLSNYTLHLYRHIAKHKAGFILYLPAACALLMAGESLENHATVKDVFLEMGIHFQIMNDYLDCFGDPKKTGKIGSDIEHFKCSWLIVKALELTNEEQKKILHEHYGKANPSDVAKVKAVYNDINLRGVFAVYESESYDKIASYFETHPNKALHATWESLASHRQLFKMQEYS